MKAKTTKITPTKLASEIFNLAMEISQNPLIPYQVIVNHSGKTNSITVYVSGGQYGEHLHSNDFKWQQMYLNHETVIDPMRGESLPRLKDCKAYLKSLVESTK